MRYFFQWMILITMALSLAACGGSSGSKGDTGATGSSGTNGTDGTNGTNGTNGEDGTIAVPSADSDLAIAQTTSTDKDTVLGALGTVTISYNISGTDNLSSDNRTRYYVYQGSASSTKVRAQLDNATVSGGTSGDYSSSSLPLDTRNKSQDNITLALTGSTIDTDAMASGTPFLIVCPGNEAGDATSCASVAITDRGYGAANTATDNRSAMYVGAATTSGTTTFYVLANSANRDTDSNLTPDNASSVATVSSDGTRNAATAPTLGTYSTALTTTATQSVDFAVEGTTQYLLTTFDNGTLWSRTTGDFSKYLDNVSGNAASSVILKSDGTNMIAVIDNGTRGSRVATINRIDNSTAPAQIASVSLLDNATATYESSLCAATGGGAVVVGTDNKTGDIGNNDKARVVFYTASYTGSSATTVTDNTSSKYSLDNATSVNTCDIAYTNVNGEFWAMFDNGSSGTFLLFTDDNGSSWSIPSTANSDNASIAIGTNGANGIDSLSLTVDPTENELVVCANDDGSLVMKKYEDNASWVNLSPTGTPVDGTDVDCAYNSDGTKIGVTYISTATNQKANFQVFYDDNN